MSGTTWGGGIAAIRPPSEWPPLPWMDGITTHADLLAWVEQAPDDLVRVQFEQTGHAGIESLVTRRTDGGYNVPMQGIVPTACLRIVVPPEHRWDLARDGRDRAAFARWYEGVCR